MKEDRKKIYGLLLISLSCSLSFSPLAWAVKFRPPNKSYYFVLPDSWKKVPSDILNPIEKGISRELSRYKRAFSNISYQYAFQPRGNAWFKGAYLLLREVDKPVSIKKLKQAFDFDSTLRTPAKGVELNDFREFAPKLGKEAVNGNTLLFFRRQKMFLISAIIKFKKPPKNYFCLTAVFLGRDSYVTLYFYFPQNDLKRIEDAKNILLSFRMRRPYVDKSVSGILRIYFILALIALAAGVFFVLTKRTS